MRRHRVVALACEACARSSSGSRSKRSLFRDPAESALVCVLGLRLEPGPIRALGGVTVHVDSGSRRARAGRYHRYPGLAKYRRNPAGTRVVGGIETAYRRGARVVSICSGVFVLAAAGLLDGKAGNDALATCRQTGRTFSARAGRAGCPVHRRRTGAHVGRKRGRVSISAFHIIRADFGAEVANQVAKRLVRSTASRRRAIPIIPSTMNTHATRGLARLLRVGGRESPA